MTNYAKGFYDELCQDTAFIGTFERQRKITETRYGNSLKNNIYQNIIRHLSLISFVLFFIMCYISISTSILTSISSRIGLILSVIVLFALLLEFLFFKPLIFNIMKLSPPNNVISELKLIYKDKLGSLNVGTPKIQDWKTFFTKKYNLIDRLNEVIVLGDRLRFFCISKVILRAIALIVWYSIVIMYCDLSFNILEPLAEPAEPAIVRYLFYSFSLFLSVDSSFLSKSMPGILLLFGDLIIYMSVFIIVANRISDNLSIVSSSFERIAHQITAEYLDLPPSPPPPPPPHPSSNSNNSDDFGGFNPSLNYEKVTD